MSSRQESILLIFLLYPVIPSTFSYSRLYASIGGSPFSALSPREIVLPWFRANCSFLSDKRDTKSGSLPVTPSDFLQSAGYTRLPAGAKYFLVKPIGNGYDNTNRPSPLFSPLDTHQQKS